MVSALQSRLRASRITPLPHISVTPSPDTAPLRTSYSAPTSPVARRTRAAQLPPLGPLPAVGRLVRDGKPSEAVGAGVGEAAACDPPRATSNAADGDRAAPASPHDPAGLHSMQQPLQWLPGYPHPGPSSARGRSAGVVTAPLPLHPLAVEQASQPNSPIAADASPVWRGMTGDGGAMSWQPGAPVSEERDISEEFDVALLLGDLNYRCVC